MADEQPAKRSEPRNGPFHDPAVAVGPQAAAILVAMLPPFLAIRTGEHDAAGGEPFAQRVAVVPAVADQVAGQTPMWGYARGERRVDERDFRRGGRGNGDSQRNTLTLDQYHAL